MSVTPTSSAGKPRTVKLPSLRPVTSFVAEIAPGMLDSIWVKLAPGTPLMTAWRLMVDTALGAYCTSMLPLPSDTELPVTLTASSWSAR